MRARPCPGSAEIVFSIRRELAVAGAGVSVGTGVVVGCASPGRRDGRARREARHERRQTEQDGEQDEQSAAEHPDDASRMYEMAFSRG